MGRSPCCHDEIFCVVAAHRSTPGNCSCCAFKGPMLATAYLSGPRFSQHVFQSTARGNNADRDALVGKGILKPDPAPSPSIDWEFDPHKCNAIESVLQAAECANSLRYVHCAQLELLVDGFGILGDLLLCWVQSFCYKKNEQCGRFEMRACINRMKSRLPSILLGAVV
jgi:hypothetical protein